LNDDQRKAMFANRNNNYSSHLLSKSYFDKQEKKASNADYMSNKHNEKMQERFKTRDRLHDMIPFGQPIQVGHHSESMHRNNLKRQDSNMRKGIEHGKIAEHYENKADNIRNAYAVNAGDPDAVVKLKNRIEDFEAEKADKKEKLKTAPDGSNFTDGTKDNLRMYISSLTTKIRNTKQRITVLEQKQSLPEIQEQSQSGNGVNFKVDKEDNRIRIYFDGKPSEEIRTRLKSRAWRWSPRAGAWQKQISDQALEQAKSYL